MNKYLIIFLCCLLHTSAFADADIRLQFSQDSVTTGAMVKVRMVADPASTQSFPLQSLKNQTLGEKIYVQSVSPLIRREGDSNFYADAEIVFIRDPAGNEVRGELNGHQLRLFWNNVKIKVIETPPDYVLGDFTIPSAKNILLWALMLMGIGFLVYIAFILKKKLQAKSQLKNSKLKIKSEVLSCRTYDEVVNLWKQKRIITTTFPHTDDPFTKLEKVLFKYQFKPFQSQDEQARVMEAYRGFVRDVEGGFNGI